jgi:uncharacterized YigZ family protein
MNMLAERYAIPNGVATAELIIKNSRFIGTVGRASAAEMARAFVAAVSQTYAGASHNAWAYRLQGGPQGEIGSSDDGEPGGTAGRPMLAVLEGSGLHEVVAVGTRYFGGIKLGTGGLVRAYSGCVREALAALPTQEMVLHHTARVEVDYAVYGQLAYHLPRLGVKVEKPSFTDRVSLTLVAPSEALGEIARLLQELTNGQIILSHWNGHRYDPSN